ncbi:DUF3859 domain-containing protein [uncultured Propionivibrio sp.]|uniref:DUF3859 domain-containing protein n=1 Tax=uncultured Propionivibrio sp. TaxID=426737 RepID=UPI0029BFA9B3|nr:DUF3859 domain-containing protein [uncultured Propionivibrio sp.]
MRIFNSFLLFNVLALAFPLAAQSAVQQISNSPTGEVVKAGVCVQEQVTLRYSQPQSTAGYATNGPLKIVQETNTIPLQKNIGFGFAWRAKNIPPQAKVIYLVEHPAITRPDGTTLEHFEEPLLTQSEGGQIESIDCYMLSEDYELVPGQWSLSIYYQGVQLVRQTFHIQAPK